MAKQIAVTAIIVSAFCFASVFAEDTFTVEGKVYCDPCRLAFETRLSHPLEGMLVSLVCHKNENKTVTYLVQGRTDAEGFYRLPVEGDHQAEMCEVMTEKSVHHKCKEPMSKKEGDRIVLTKNSGVSSSKRFVNPLGFMTHSIDARCIQVAQELGLGQSDDY